jgi:hypothetical protein
VFGPGHVQPDETLQLHGGDERRRVDGYGQGPFVVVAEQPDRERHDRDQAQEQQVADQERVVHAGDDPEDAVVGQPELAEDHEAQHIGAQRRQDLVERPGEVGAVQARRHLEVEGEQGDGDGEDGVGEGEHPVGLDRPAPQPAVQLSLSLPLLLAPGPLPLAPPV